MFHSRATEKGWLRQMRMVARKTINPNITICRLLRMYQDPCKDQKCFSSRQTQNPMNTEEKLSHAEATCPRSHNQDVVKSDRNIERSLLQFIARCLE
jgi:hypothetical protein